MRKARIAVAVVLVLIWSTLGVVRPVTDWLRERALLQPFILTVAGLLAITTIAKLRNRAIGIVLALAAITFAIAWHTMASPEERVHLIEYGIVAVLFAHALGSVPKALVATVAAGWVDEGIQALLPSRHYDLRDVAFNALAGVIGLSLLLIYRATRRLPGSSEAEQKK